MKRKITDDLLAWKQSPRKKSLLIFGARQVGKTYIIEDFAKSNYSADKIITMNFELFPEAKEFFENDLSPKAIMRKIQSNIKYMHVNFKDNEDNPYLIFLDEIQSCENAIIALKAFTQENKLYHVIASGSLLGVAIKRQFGGSYPVGYVQHMELKPFDFEEFLWANGYSESFIENIRNITDIKTISAGTHDALIDMFRKYIVIGGLPEAINTFIETNDYHEVYTVQNDLRRGYIQDIRKYVTDNNGRVKIEKCFASIPYHLKEQNKKFMYKRVEHNGRERMFADSLDWLAEAGLVLFCYNTKDIAFPLESYKIDNSFKLYMFDTGILMSMFDEAKRYNVLNGNDDLDVGGIYENAVACVISQNSRKNELYYFNLPNMDIDFLTEKGDTISAIEVKSGNTLKSPSLNKLVEKCLKNYIQPIKLSSKIVYEDDIIKNEPFYKFALAT